MAGQVYLTLSGPQGSIGLGVSATENTFTELVDETVSKSLGRVYAGRTINGYIGSFVAGHGGGYVQVRNRVTKVVKMLEPIPAATGEKFRPCTPFVIEPDDIAETFIEAVPT